MSINSCEVWADLVDREALGEPISEPDSEFRAKHVSRCAVCRAESETWTALADALSDSSLLESPTLAAGRTDPLRRLARHFGWKRSLAGAALVATTALCVVLARPAFEPASAPATFVTGITFSAVSGEVLVGLRPASAGLSPSASEVIHVQQGRACLSFEPGISACLDTASQATTRGDGLSRGIDLRVGRVVAKLERQPPGGTFSIMTPRGAVVAKGTIFSVEVSPSHQVTVRVHEGVVSVERPGATAQALPAPSEGALTTRFERRPLTKDSAAHDTALIGVATLLSSKASSRLLVHATPAGARVALDGVELGQAPVSALVGGTRRLAVAHPDYAPVSERLSLTGSSSLSRNYELVPLDSMPAEAAPEGAESALGPPDASVVEAGARPSAAELLMRARSLRRSVRYREAAATYRRLFSLHPKSAESRASLVSLGELQLSELGEPKGALESFDAYLRGGGALVQEARYGRIRALAKLGRKGDERRAIEQFLTDYPRSVQASSLRARQIP